MSHFIVFDGIECAGKSTQMEVAKSHLESLGYDVVITREPGGTPIAESIRDVLLSINQLEDFEPNTELLLAYAAREQHIQSRIRPAMEAGKVVLCDRFSSSTYIYQVKGHGASLALFDLLEKHVVQSFQEPDAYLIFDLDAKTSAKRLALRDEAPDRMEMEGSEFFEQVAEGYKEFAAMKNDENPGLATLIDATKTIPEVTVEVKAAIDGIIKRKLMKDEAHKLVSRIKDQQGIPAPQAGGVLGL